MVATLPATRISRRGVDAAVRRDAAPAVAGYRLLKTIGRGGMGKVYLAQRVDCRARCALKVIRPELQTDPASTVRFQQEIDTLRRVEHQNVVRLVEAGQTAKGWPFLAMEYLAGCNLADLVSQEGPLSPARFATVMRSLCAALSEVHRCGIVHNDIKPANIVAEVGDVGGGGVKLIDFGLSESAATIGVVRRAASSGGCAGSPLFASPESYEGITDSRSDIYCVGATAYYLLTGRPVFDADSPLAAYVSHLTRQPTPVRQLQKHVSPPVDAVILKCLHKNPQERFQNAEALANALQSAVRSWGNATPVSRRPV